VPDDHEHLADPERVPYELEVSYEQRLPRDLEHDLRNVGSARVDAATTTGGGDDGDPRGTHGCS